MSVTKMSTKEWDKVTKKRQAEYTRYNVRILLGIFTFSLWGITIIYGISVLTHQTWNLTTLFWFLFSPSMITLLIYTSLSLTILSLTIWRYHKARPL